MHVGVQESMLEGDIVVYSESLSHVSALLVQLRMGDGALNEATLYFEKLQLFSVHFDVLLTVSFFHFIDNLFER